MSVLVDSSVWSLGLRRRRRDRTPDEDKTYFRWRELLIAGEACLIGLIFQETLSGLASGRQFDSLQQRLTVVEALVVDMATFILAAEFYNACRARGISPEAVDMTICAAAHTHNVPIFTTDPDFSRYQRHLPITLFQP